MGQFKQTMISTKKKQNIPRFVVTSNLGALLKERGLTQKELAKMTGISERAISRLKNRKSIKRIDCATAIKICLVLSVRSRTKTRRSPVALDLLFPIVASEEYIQDRPQLR